ncbi:unnamed protein product [Psylliodes chrysocephalus]|uniref:Carboxylic ester hydrolase n=1 Tax=Psylliodes chrysocephalus TaxID=3402493 RepID=A0A9P0DC89_9CUCU|nr:unnamed protein product [Psylliodes chrysocephala]
MSTEDNEVSGNNGLKDQVMALKWIKNNIKYFGGNPESITLTGISAGGASVHYHYLSPLSRGLFHKGLSQSGTVIQNWALVKHPLSKAQTVARNLHCPTNSTKEMVACLKKTDAKKVILSMTKLYNYFESIPFVIFGPVIEKGNNPFLPEHPYKMLKDGNVYDLPWIAANVKDEGLFPTAFFVMNQMMGELDTKWNEIAPYLLDLYETVDKSKQLDMMQKIKKFYFDDKPISDETTYNMVQMTSDRFYFMDCEKALRLQARVNKSPVYYYFFSYLLNKPILPTFGIKRGVGHGDDGALLFKMFGASSKLETKDEMMMKMFTEFLALYAKTGIPMMNNVEWKPIQPDSKMLNVLKVESPDEVKMIEMVKIGNNEFWDSMAIAENDKLYP